MSLIFKKNTGGSLYVIIGIIFISPILGYFYSPPLPFWMFASILGVIIYSKEILIETKRSGSLLLFILVLLSFGVVEMLKGETQSIFRFLLFVSSFLLFPGIMGLKNKITFERYDEIVSKIIVVVCLYAFYQALGNYFGLPLTGKEIYRGRVYAEGVQQITSFFEEPAFLSSFLFSALFISLFILNRIKLSFIIVVVLILTQSVSGLFSIFILILLFFKERFSLKNLKLIIGTPFLVFLIFIALSSILQIDIFDKITDRFTNEVLGNFQYLGENPVLFTVGTSGGIRVLNEINYFLYVLYERPIAGFGIGYDDDSLNRRMALNGFVEFFFRMGLIGLIAFGFLIMNKIKNIKGKKLILFIYTLVYFTIDGAIAKPQFWFIYSLVFLGMYVKYKGVYSK